MSSNAKYFYIKLKDRYFDQDNIKILESLPNGYTYSLIIIKMYLKSAKYNGALMMTDRIPYNPDTVDTLAKVINHDVDHVKEAIRAAVELDLITILDTGQMWCTEIQNFIGQSSSEADRIREYRKQLTAGNAPVQLYDNSTPETETETETDPESNKNSDSDKDSEHPGERGLLDRLSYIYSIETTETVRNFVRRYLNKYDEEGPLLVFLSGIVDSIKNTDKIKNIPGYVYNRAFKDGEAEERFFPSQSVPSPNDDEEDSEEWGEIF